MKKQFSMSMYVNRDDMYKDMMEYIRELEGRNQWVSVKQDEPPKDGTEILCCYEGYNDIFVASFRTYHPNSEGKKCWRRLNGNKTGFTHWMPKLPIPEKE